MSTTTLLAPWTRSIAPPMPLTIFPGTIQFAMSPFADTCIAPRIAASILPPRIMPKEVAESKYDAPGLLGFAASQGSPETVAATGTITLRYVRPTRLGRLHAVAEIERTEGRKIFLTGQLADAEGTTVTADAVYIALRT